MAKALVELALKAVQNIKNDEWVSLRIRLDRMGIILENVQNTMEDLRAEIQQTEELDRHLYCCVNLEGVVIPHTDQEWLSQSEANTRNLELHKMGVGMVYVEVWRIENRKVVHPPERQSE
jgi:hypothetical protein